MPESKSISETKEEAIIAIPEWLYERYVSWAKDQERPTDVQIIRTLKNALQNK